MNENLTHYMTGDSDDFQDFLADSACTEDDKLDALLEIGKNGWDECIEILVSRDDVMLLTQKAAQAWVYMASNGHTDTWMQMLPAFYQASARSPDMWNDALQVGRDDAAMDGHWEVYALTKALEGLVALKTPPDVAQMALLGMRIELMHGLDPTTARQDVADAFAYKHIAQVENTKSVSNVFSGINFA